MIPAKWVDPGHCDWLVSWNVNSSKKGYLYKALPASLKQANLFVLVVHVQIHIQVQCTSSGTLKVPFVNEQGSQSGRTPLLGIKCGFVVIIIQGWWVWMRVQLMVHTSWQVKLDAASKDTRNMVSLVLGPLSRQVRDPGQSDTSSSCPGLRALNEDLAAIEQP